MRGLTWTRDATGGHPAVNQYRALASECRVVMGPDAEISYAADWSEYFGHHPQDGSGHVVFHLDPLWADAAISHVAIDWYPPLGDWRASDGGVDAAIWKGPSDPVYLAAQVAGGEGFDWYYADDADRAAQARTPILDTAHGEDWVFRPKDLVGWWSNLHHDRIGGMRSATPTAWTPGLKPIRLTEFGCAAVDRGGNAPNLFQDPKSAESALPPHSTGARDDLMQRRALEAVLAHFREPANNPVSATYGGPMLDGVDAWCWDARPYPAFPTLNSVWADARAWRAGHWLNGRLSGDGADLLAAILRRGGVAEEDFEIGLVDRSVEGIVVDRPMRTRDAFAPLLAAFGMVGAERGGRIALIGDTAPCQTLEPEDLALPDGGAAIMRRRETEILPSAARVRFIDENDDYQTASAMVRSAGEGSAVDVDLPLVCGAGIAARVAEDILTGEAVDTLTLHLGPLDALRLESGDVVEVTGHSGLWRVQRIEAGETVRASLIPLLIGAVSESVTMARGRAPLTTVGTPFFRILELPPLPGHEDDGRPIAVVSSEPWRAMEVWAGGAEDSLTTRALVSSPAGVGLLTQPLGSGVVGRWDETNAVMVALEGGAPSSMGAEAVLGGANALAVESGSGWELLQFRTAELVGAGEWRLAGLLRGQQGTEVEAAGDAPSGAVAVFLDENLARAEVRDAEKGTPLIWRAVPRGGPAGGPTVATQSITLTGVHGRPLSPAHLRSTKVEEGWVFSWIARTRIGGDVWDGEPTSSEPFRFRVRLVEDGQVVRVFEVSGEEAPYAESQFAADFRGGFGPDARLQVAQSNGRGGWGREAVVRLGG